MFGVDSAIRAKAAELGFDAVAVARADVPLEEDHARYSAFVAAEFHGSMAYLANNRDVRRSLADPGILPGARSVICLAQRYAVRSNSQPGIVDRIAKYARGRDYHNHVRRRLRKLAEFVRTLGTGILARPLVDTAPVLERAWAARSGLGFVGKNGMLICPGLGSFTVLGEVVTTLELPPGEPMASRCGRCEACLDACPTGALIRPFVLDARRCISYLTIEHRGPWEESWDNLIAPRLFGCDTCQDVCPFNQGQGAWIEPGGPFDPLDRWSTETTSAMLALSPDALSRHLEGSAMRRVSRDDWHRNLIAASAGETSPEWIAALGELIRDPHTPNWLNRMARRTVASAKTSGHGDRS